MMFVRPFPLLLVFSCSITPTWASKVNVTVFDEERKRPVTATVCLDDKEAANKSDLFVFGHGGGLFDADYAYLCDHLPSTVALLGSNASDDPMDLALMAADLAFLAKALPMQSNDNPSSPLFKRLNGQVILTGHSMGAAAALLAGMTPNDDVVAVGALAPGFWGEKQTALLNGLGFQHSALCDKTLLVLAGEQDCANSLALQAIPVWNNITASCGTNSTATHVLAVLGGATHCQWTSPVKGSCDFDVKCPVPRLDRSRQQQLGTYLFTGLSRSGVGLDPLLRLMKINNELSYVDGHDSVEAVSKLHSYCPCSNASAAEISWVV